LSSTVPPGLRPVRLGLSRISGFSESAARRLVAARHASISAGRPATSPFADVEDLSRRAGLDARELELLAQAGALSRLAGNRHQAAWSVAGVDTRPTALLHETRTAETAAHFDAPTIAQEVFADYHATGLSLTAHPLALLREQMKTLRVEPASVLVGYRNGQLARASGLVTHRQRPETAKGVVFVTLEDETGAVNVIVWPQVASDQRKPLLAATLLTVFGVWQVSGDIRHLIARRLIDHSHWLAGLVARSRNFH
jgi:error-prone DNA polymerase